LGIHSLIGQRLGPYELRDLIGTGGMSAVYRASRDHRDVAVKVLLPALVGTYADQFDRMARIRLDHPYIVPIIDSGIQTALNPSPSWRGTFRRVLPFALREKGPGDEGKKACALHYIVMPLLSGGTLADPIHSGRFYVVSPESTTFYPFHNIIVLLLWLAFALDYAHTQGVIHGDIQPGNVLFDDRKNAYLSDFGSPSGTPHFMAPEVWRGEPPTPASDQYAFGVLAYLLLTGRYPFEGPSRSALKEQHLNKFPILPSYYRPSLREGADDAVIRVLEKAPDDRFPDVAAFVQALREG
jgi:serine/threonine-protein kinase